MARMAGAIAAAAPTTTTLPKQVLEEIVRRYADLLRVGSLVVNGEVVRWNTDTSTEIQLRGFCSSLYAKLRKSPEMKLVADDVLHRSPYWVCKAVSINYALIEVLLFIKERVGVMCTIETRDEDGALVTYSVEVWPSKIRVALNWRGKNNIVYRNPLTGERHVKGTLSWFETEFRFPPERQFAPAYRMQMTLKRSLAARFALNFACIDKRIADAAQTLHMGEPLQVGSPSPRGTHGFGDLAALDPESSPLSTPAAGASSPSLPSSSPYQQHAEPRHFQARSVRLPATFVPGPPIVEEPPVGQLHVRLLGGKGLTQRATWPLGRPAAVTPASTTETWLVFCNCSVAGLTRRSRALPHQSCPHWGQAWDFPVHAKDFRMDAVLEVFLARESDGQIWRAEGGELRGARLLGRARVPVSAALSEWRHVSEPLEGSCGGSVELELEFVPTVGSTQSSPSEDLQEEDCTLELSGFGALTGDDEVTREGSGERSSSLSMTPPTPPTLAPLVPSRK